MTRFPAKRDTNHGEIEAVFRKMLADHVTDSSRWADGPGDLFVSFGSYSAFVEIKRDVKASYTTMQVRFHRTHPYAVIRCETVEQAVDICAEIRRRATMIERDKDWTCAPIA